MKQGDPSNDTPPAAVEEAAAAPPPKRKRRWLRRLGLVLLIGTIVAALGLMWLLANLQTDAVRETVAEVVKDQTGIAFNYRTLSVGADALLMEDIVVASAPPDRDLAPEFLHIDRVALAWQLGDLLAVHRKITSAVVEGVRLHVVIDDDGSHSVGRLLAGLPPSSDDEPAKPLSSALEALKSGLPATVESLRVPGMRLTVSLRRAGKEQRRVVLGDLALEGRATIGVDQPELALKLVPDTNGAALQWTGHTELPAAVTPLLVGPLAPVAGWFRDGLRLPLEVSGTVSVKDARVVQVGGHLGVGEAFEWPPGLGVATLAAFGLTVTFDPDAGRTQVELKQTQALDGKATLALKATLADRKGGGLEPTLDRLRAGVELDGAGRFLPAHLGRVSLRGVHGHLEIDQVALSGSDGLPTVGRLVAGATMEAVDAAAAGTSLQLRGARPQAVLSRALDGKLRLRLSGPVASAKVAQPKSNVVAEVVGIDAMAALDDVYISLPGGGAVPIVKGGRLSGHGRVARLAAAAAPAELTVTGAQVKFYGEVDADGAELRVAGGLRGLRGLAIEANADAVLGPVEVTLTVVDRGAPALLHGGPLAGVVVNLGAHLTRLRARGAGHGVNLRDANLSLDLAEVSAPPLDDAMALGKLDLMATIRSLKADDRGTIERLSMNLKGRDLVPDTKQPLAARGRIEFDAKAGPLSARAKLDKGRSTLSWQGSVEVADFTSVPALAKLPPKVSRMLDWRSLRFSAETRGVASQLLRDGVPDLEHVSKLSLRDLHGKTAGVAFNLKSLNANLSGANSGRKHNLRWDVRLPDPRIGTYRGVGSHALVGQGEVEPARPQLRLDVKAEAPAGPRLEGQLRVGWNGGQGGLVYAASGNISKLAPIARALPAALRKAACIDLDRLSASFDAVGIVRSSRARLMDGSAFAGPKLIRRLVTRHRISGKAERLFCRRDDMEVSMPSVEFSTEVELARGGLHVTGHSKVNDLRFDAAGVHGRLRGVQGKFDVRTGMLVGDPKTAIVFSGDIDDLKQSAAPTYPIGHASVSGKVYIDRLGSVRMEQLSLRNRLAGSELDLQGGVDLGKQRKPAVERVKVATPAAAQAAGAVPGRQGIALTGELRQDIGVLAATTKMLQGKGKLVVPFRVESGDMKVVRAEADVRLVDVAVTLDEHGVFVSGVNGNLPVYQEMALGGPRGVRLLGGGANNAYSRWRFQDQRPFLSGDYYLSISKLGKDEIVVGPMAGNAIVDRNVLRLDQLELKALGGTITGQCTVDLRGRETEMMFRGNLTGLRSSDGGERLDANAALTFLPGQMSLSGRAQVLRMGRQHLLDMLDLWDPYHENVRANQLRLALKVGYPKRAHMRFQHGFMDMGVKMGGLAAAVKLGEIRGVPLGPMFQKYLGPTVDKVLGKPPPKKRKKTKEGKKP